MRIEQYLTHTDYALWEVIVNGDESAAIASVSGGAEATIPPKTTEQNIAMRNELEAKTIMLLAIPDEHLLKFHGIKDAKTLWEASKTRFQKLISQLEIHGEVISQEDANMKLLRSLPSSWNTHTLIIRNKSDLDTLSMDDLYNNLKGQAFALTYADDVMFSFFANQSNSLQLDNEDLKQIDTDDLEEMDLKWRRGHFAKECRAPRNQGNRNRDNIRRVVPMETPANALVVADGIGSSSSDTERKVFNKANLEIIAYQLGLESLEAIIVVNRKNEAVFEEDIKVRDNSITELKNQLGESLKEKDDLKLKLENFKTSSKNLINLINSQISSKDKTGLGYDSQLNERDLNNIHMNKSEGYHAVPPPYTGNFMPLRPDLSFDGLDDFIFKSAMSKTVTSVHEAGTSASKTSKESMKKPKIVSKKPFNQKSAAKTNNFNEKINVAKHAGFGDQQKNVIDHISKDSGSYMIKIFNYVDPQGKLKSVKQSSMDGFDTGEVQITATIDGNVKLVSEASIRRLLKLEDSYGISTLPNTEIFEQLALMSPKNNFWEEFSSNIVTAIICLATNRTFNFSKMIFKGMVKNLDNEAASIGVDVRHGGVVTTVSSLDAGQGSGNINKTLSMPYDSPLSRVYLLRSDEGRMQQNKFMKLVTKLTDRVLALETDLQQTKKVYSTAFTKLIMKGIEFETKDIITVERLLYIRRSASKHKGKGIMTESEHEQTTTKLQQRQERAGYEAVVRLQEQLDEEER
nr:hypothetical protein [Tanacetum cinerariifolium]